MNIKIFSDELKSRRLVGILILLPLIYTLCFATMFEKNLVTGVPIIVENLDDGTFGQDLIQDLTDTPEVEVIFTGGAANGIETEMAEREAFGAVVIPKDFSEKISRGESVSVELIVDYTNTVLGGVVTRAVQSVISTESAEILVTQRIAAGWNTYQAENSFLTSSTRIFYNPTSGFTDFFLTVLILHAVQISIVFSIAPVLVEEKFFRRELFDKPLKIFAAKLFLYSAISISMTAICLSIVINFFGMQCHGNFFEILAIIAAFVFCMTAFALFVGALNKFSYRTIIYTLAYIMPSVLFTGAIWKRYSMDALSLFLSFVMPIGYAADDLRNLFLKGVSVGWESHAAILICMGGIFFSAGLLAMRFTGGRENVSDNSAGICSTD